jgi:hypothetical protein
MAPEGAHKGALRRLPAALDRWLLPALESALLRHL